VRVIPVVDLMHGAVVRGVGGRRHEYQPIKSILAKDSRPATVAHALVQMGLTDVYVADLDAIAGSEPAWDIYRELADCGLTVSIDAGLAKLDHARAMLEFGRGCAGLGAIIVGLESIDGSEMLSSLCELVGPERLIFSLDLKAGRPLTRAAAWRFSDRLLEPLDIAATAIDAGVRRMIVLDLADVGMGQGSGTEALCHALRERDPHLELIGGGGVRGLEDLAALTRAGCNAALVASALHDGRLTAEQIRSVGRG
jgi:phosphoribosylformimino-5-aminoimidazole carboxamide ribotide isomerase